ncbi:MAG TPA: type II secretion system F family protein [Planctomycetota bacterium]|nr:type II secretion system F family protein [Planctomycetota bacterium]
MANFRYAAKDQTGRTLEGVLDASDKNQALETLRRQNLTPVKVESGGARCGGRGARAAGGAKFQLFKPRAGASRQDLVLFTRQLSTMIASGLSLLESLEVLHEQAESPPLKLTCGRLIQELRAGSDLSAAMETCPRAFSPLYVSMVRAGEASGQMDIILERLADYVEAADELRREVKSAMTYPVISLVLVLGITMFLMLGVVPTFRQVFESLDSELPGLTLFVLGVSDWLKANWYIAFGLLIAFAGSVMAFKKTETGGYFFDVLALKLPVFGPLARKIALARFSRTFATLIRSGVPIIGTLDIVSDTAGNRVVSRAVQKSKESVKNGNMLSEPLAESPVFPPMVTKMIAIGEKSGALEQLLEKIAEFYDSQVKAQIKSLTSLIEPLLITFMGVIVGGVVLSVFLPILNIVGELGKQG